VKRILIPCFVFVMLVSLVGGAGAQDASTTDPASTLRVGITYDLYTSNPLRACGCGAEYEWMALQYDMLLNFDKNTLEPAPGIATEVPTVENGGISADGLTYTFTIRDDATWQDGEPVTARDVAFTYRFMLDNKIGAYDNYLPYDPTFETPNDTTFIWKQKQPSLAPIAPPYVPILPEHIWSRFDGDPKAAKEFENIPAIGSGPFQLVEWKEGQYFRMVANPDYWGGAPHVGEIVFRAFDNPETMALALRDGELDIVSSLPPNIARSLEGQSDISVHEAAGRGFMNFAFNFGGQGDSATNNPAIADLTVRQAIAHAIDKQALVDKVLLGKGTVGAGLMPPSSPWYWEPAPDQAYTFDLDLAADMLEEAGYLDTDGDGVREMPNGGEPLELEVVAASSVPSAPPSARLIAEWLGEIGIDVRVKAVGDGAMNEAWTQGTFDAYLWGWNPDPDPDFILSIFTTAECKGWSDGCYSNADYDQLYEQQRTASSVDDRAAIVADMESFVYDNVPEMVLYYESDMEAFRTDTFTGYSAYPPPDGYMVFGYLPAPYMGIRPMTAADGSAVTSGSGAIPLWVWGGLIAIIVLVFVAIARARRSREDDRI
jgi:peptide/nickel transport system substrate-binding protein